MVLRCALTVLPLLLPLVLRAQASAKDERVESPVHALLVGIQSHAEESDLAPLHGPRRDVDAMEQILRDRFAVPEANILTLRDQEATAEAVLRAIDAHLVQRAEPGDHVLFYFAGHGSRVPDATEHEPDGLDSSLLAYDSRSGETPRDLTDDVLYSVFRPLAERNVVITVLVDACHSGGVLRGDEGMRRARAAAPATEPIDDPQLWPGWPAGVPFLDDEEGGREDLARYVQISACGRREVAYEYGPPEEARGLFSLCLIEELRRVAPGTSYRQLAHRISQRMTGLPASGMQTVWVEGSVLDRQVFGGEFVEPVDGFAVTAAGKKALEIAAGTLHGVFEGASLTIVRADGTGRGSATVRSARLGSSRARWSPHEDFERGEALYARLTELPETRQLSMACPDDDLRPILNRGQWAVLEEDPGEAPYVVTRESGGVVIRTADGVRVSCELRAARDADLAAAFERECRHEARFRDLWNLSDPARAGRLSGVTAAFVPPTAGDLGLKEEADGGTGEGPEFFDAGLSVAPQRAGCPELTVPSRGSNEGPRPMAVIEVVNGSKEPVYVYVLSLTETRDVTVLDPNPEVSGPEEALLKPGDPRRVGLVPVAPKAEEFPLRRAMLDRHLVLFTTRPVDVAGLEHWPGKCEAGVDRGGGLPAGLRWVLTRGHQGSGDPTYGVVCLDLRIQRAED